MTKAKPEFGTDGIILAFVLNLNFSYSLNPSSPIRKLLTYIVMKQSKTIITLLLLLLTISTYGQVGKRKNYFPIWTYHQKNINIHGVSLGIGTARAKPRNTNTNGMKIEIFGAGILIPIIPQSPVAQNEDAFIELSKEPISEVINGLSISTFGTVCDCITNGINIGLIGHINFQVNGFTGSLFMNFSQRHNGVQFALQNESYYMNGLQLGLFNYGYKTKGLQIGLLRNGSEEMNGLQLGLFNKSEKFRGIQIGLWNVNQKRKLPLINWNFKRDTE
jgi:hypothetical protein